MIAVTPEQIAKTSEHSQQAAFFCWASKQEHYALAFMFAVPNGGLRNKVQASKLKAEGVKPGVPDVFLPFPCGQFAGLYLEFKKPGTEGHKSGGLKPEQVKYREYLTKVGYSHKVCFSWLQAATFVVEYLNN